MRMCILLVLLTTSYQHILIELPCKQPAMSGLMHSKRCHKSVWNGCWQVWATLCDYAELKKSITEADRLLSTPDGRLFPPLHCLQHFVQIRSVVQSVLWQKPTQNWTNWIPVVNWDTTRWWVSSSNWQNFYVVLWRCFALLGDCDTGTQSDWCISSQNAWPSCTGGSTLRDSPALCKRPAVAVDTPSGGGRTPYR